MKKIIILLIMITVSSVYSQILVKEGYKLMQNDDQPSDYFLGNGIVDIHTNRTHFFTLAPRSSTSRIPSVRLESVCALL